MLLCVAVPHRVGGSAISRVWRGLWALPVFRHVIPACSLGPRGPCDRAQHWFLVFTETQNDINAVDVAPRNRNATLPYLVEVGG